MGKFVDSALTLEILKQDSGLLPKPKEKWNTFIPEEGDIAYVFEEKCYYQFDGTSWNKYDIESEAE